MSGNSDLIRARLRQAREHMEQAGEDRIDLEREKYRLRLMDLRTAIMELSAHPLASKSDRLVLHGLQKSAERLGRDFPLTARGRLMYQRGQVRDGCARRLFERGCPND